MFYEAQHNESVRKHACPNDDIGHVIDDIDDRELLRRAAAMYQCLSLFTIDRNTRTASG